MLSAIYAECRIQALSAKCHYTECCYAECYGALMGNDRDTQHNCIQHNVLNCSNSHK